MDTVLLIQVILTFVLASAAVYSSISAKKSAKAARDAAESSEKNVDLQVITRILSEFSSDGMQESLSVLWDAFSSGKWEEIKEKQQNGWRTKKFNGVDKKVDAARRRVAWYFARIHILHKRGILGDDVVKDLVSEGQVKDILIEKVEPLEQPGRGEDVYKFFKDLYGIKKDGEGGNSVE